MLAGADTDPMDQLRGAVAVVSWQRNSGDGTVPSADVDALLDAARAVMPAFPGCEVCGSVSRPRRRTADPDPRVPQIVCQDAAACCAEAGR